MLKPETCRVLHETLNYLADEVLRLTAIHDSIEAVLRDYGGALANAPESANGKPAAKTVETKPPSTQAAEEKRRLPRSFGSEKEANNAAGAYKRAGRKVRVVTREGAWVVEECA